MLQNLRNHAQDESGFTLIELLVVILIIGILAAIALPSFLGQQKKGQDASAKSDVRNAVTQVESCYADTQDYSRCAIAATMTSAGLTSVTPSGATTSGYTLSEISKSGNTYNIVKDATTGTVSRGCSGSSCSSTSW